MNLRGHKEIVRDLRIHPNGKIVNFFLIDLKFLFFKE